MLPFAWARLRKSVPLVVPVSSFARTAVATAVMAAAVLALGLLVPVGHTTGSSAGRLVLLVSVGAVVFVATARAVGVKELGLLSARYRALRA